MINQSIIDYIIQCRNLGMDQTTITQNLLATGWQMTDINLAFQTVGGTQSTAVAKAKPRHHWLQISLIIVLVLLVLGGAAFAAYYFFIKPTDQLTVTLTNTNTTPTDSVVEPVNVAITDLDTTADLTVPDELQLKTITLPDSENAYDSFQAAAVDAYINRTEYPTVDALLTPEGWDQTVANRLLEDKAEVNAELNTAISLPGYQNPATASAAALGEQTAKPFTNLRNLTTLNSVAALSAMQQNNDMTAFAIALSYLQLGHHIATSQDDALSYLGVNSMVMQPTLETVQQLTRLTTLDAITLKKYVANLQDLTDSGTGVSQAFALEYAIQAGAVDALAAGDFGPFEHLDAETKKLFADPQYFDVTATKQLLLDVMVKNEATLDGPCNSIQSVDVPESTINIETDELKPGVNIVGEYIAAIMSKSLTNVPTQRCTTNQLLGVTQLMLMLKGYDQDHGALPANLTALVPIYGEALPLDPYTQTIFDYNSTAKTILYETLDGISQSLSIDFE